MKKAKIKINQSLDKITIDVDQNSNGIWGMVCQWNIGGYTLPQKDSILKEAKAVLFDEVWKLTEMGYKVEVIPYIN